MSYRRSSPIRRVLGGSRVNRDRRDHSQPIADPRCLCGHRKSDHIDTRADPGICQFCAEGCLRFIPHRNGG